MPIRWRPLRDHTRVQLTELKVFSEALPKRGELTGSYHAMSGQRERVNGRRTYALAEDVGTLTVPGEKNVNVNCNTQPR
jgi:hypothetical protein